MAGVISTQSTQQDERLVPTLVESPSVMHKPRYHPVKNNSSILSVEANMEILKMQAIRALQKVNKKRSGTSKEKKQTRKSSLVSEEP